MRAARLLGVEYETLQQVTFESHQKYINQLVAENKHEELMELPAYIREQKSIRNDEIK